MKKTISLFPALLCFLFFSCTPKQITDGIVQLEVMTDICIQDITYVIVKEPTDNADGEIDFKVVLSNPHDVDGHGTIRLAIGAVGKDVKLHQDQEILDGEVVSNGVQVDLPSGEKSVVDKPLLYTFPQTYWETPPGTVFKANSFNAYTTPDLCRIAYSKGAKYTVSCGKFLPPNTGVGKVYSSCQAFEKHFQF